jgi:ABC-type transporter Mla subunit MlaD
MEKDWNQLKQLHNEAVDAAKDAEDRYEDAMANFDTLAWHIAELEDNLDQALVDVGKCAQQQAVTKLECSRAWARVQALESKNKQ